MKRLLFTQPYSIEPKTGDENTVPVVCNFLCHGEKQPGDAVYINGVWMCYDCMREILKRHRAIKKGEDEA
jgi:hypothetical protein